ncbi:MAG: lantibiotic dehydratase [Saprospiraceae bacterium]
MSRKKNVANLYPHVLCRVGTLPYDLLKSIQWSDPEQLLEMVRIYLKLQAQATSSDLSGREKSNIGKQIRKLESDFVHHFSNEQSLHRTAFFALSGNPMLQKGLLQSSPSLWEGIQRYRQQPVSVYRKKERQTERSLAQYLARICTKTSPFSTFTGLSFTKISGKNSILSSDSNDGKIRVNNYVLAQLQELLSGYPDFYQHLAVQINPTLRSVGEEYVFLINSRNVESIQRVEVNDVLVLLLESIRTTASGQMKFATLKNKMVREIEAPAEQLDAYLAELIRYGLINWVWPVSSTDPKWLDHLLARINPLESFQGHQLLLEALNDLRETAKLLPSLTAEKRWPRINGSLKKLRETFEAIAANSPSENKEITKQAFVAFQGKNITLNAQNLFFEDHQVHGDFDWSKKDLKKGVEELAKLIDLVLPLRLYPEMEVPLHFFKTHYARGERVSLLKFYEDFYHAIRKEDVFSGTAAFSKEREIIALRKQVVKELRTHIEINYDFNVHLPVRLLNTVFSQLPIQQKAASVPRTDSYGALLQLQKSETGRYKSYIDAVFTGYGKMLGRFLHLFPDKHTEELKGWIEELRGKDTWADLSDASFHNANAHPLFLKTFISASGTQQSNPQSTTQLPLLDLFVSYNESLDKLKLFHQEIEITTFNFGLEALQTRSPLYRLLSIFCTEQPDLEPLKIILRQASRKEKDGWILYPRIEVGDYLILQRRAWYIPLTDIPLRANKETEAMYFLRVNAWRQKCELPRSVFITVQPNELEGQEENTNLSADKRQPERRLTDAYKPQYINFNTPMLVSHFGRELPKVKRYLKVEEFLPGDGEMVTVEGRERAVELVVQF